MFHSSSILRSFPLRAETTVDLSGSSMLPFPNVPCSLTPPQSPVTIASCGDLLLPSSQYDAVGLRFTIITRLNRFTCVTACSSLVPTLNSCHCLHEPKARFPVGRLIPLSEAGISPAERIRLFLTHRIDGANLRDVGQTVDATEGHSLRRFAPQHVELVSKNQDFRLKPCSRPEQPGQRADQQPEKMSHRDRASPDSRLFASRMRFPVGTMAPTTVFLH